MPVVETTTETPSPAIQPPNVVPTDHIPVPKNVYDDLLATKTRLAQFEAETATKLREAEEARSVALLEANKIKEGVEGLKKTHADELQAERQKLQETETRARQYARTNALSQSLRRFELVNPRAMQDVIRDVEGSLEVHPAASGGFETRTADFKTVDQVLDAYFANPENAYKLKAATQGGTGAPAGGQQTTPTPAATPPPAGHSDDFGTWLLKTVGATPPTAAPFSHGPNPASVDMGKPFGLKAKVG